MAITLAVGTTVEIASTYGAVKAMSALSNDNPGVATLEASHGILLGDYFEVTSGWQRLTNRVVRAGTVSTNDVELEGVNTTSTTRYPAGTGTGSVREITAWQQIGQLSRDLQVSGGDQQFGDITTLTDVIDQQIPTRRSPVEITLPLFFDPTLTYYAIVAAAAETATLTAIRFVYPNGVIVVGNAYWSQLEFPTIEDSTLRGRIDVALRGLSTLYTS
jgi:hypothetical protein